MKHLTDEQLAGWLAGEEDQQTGSHLDSCPQCNAEALELRDGISRYAVAMRRQSSFAENAHMNGRLAPRRTLALHRLRWAGSGALALLLAASTAWLMIRPPAQNPTMQSYRTIDPAASSQNDANSKPSSQLSDDELLEAVNNDLSREVPEALSPVSAISVERNKLAATSGAATSGSVSHTSLRRKTNVP
ncbi:MAG: hypothetical protein ABSD13_15355 [Candidatus Korobacteraceae bacterium]|jgi:hypothetical protein